MKRNTGFYGKGTPKIAFYGPVGKPYAASASPWVKRNSQPRHWSLAIPDGKDWDWCLALQLHPSMEFEVILCDYKGPAVYEIDDINDAPKNCRDRIRSFRGFKQTRSRAVYASAKRYRYKVGKAIEVKP